MSSLRRSVHRRARSTVRLAGWLSFLAAIANVTVARADLPGTIGMETVDLSGSARSRLGLLKLGLRVLRALW
ncbi:MAG: hypothetical protein HC890_14980 [Chloroflexaceae bacterium]|nr:hypothetical protein [Chloroflexaceae bacterium]